MCAIFTCPPILFIIFNRPDTTKIVFDRIRATQPKQFFIAADGPRPDFPTDIEQCEQTRKIVDMVDWECEVHTLFREKNLGCKRGVSTAIDWFFENVEEGIILEDDCVPHPTFFPYCSELLSYYKDEKRVMMIGGNSFQNGRKRGKWSYYFSSFGHIWGWATWRRAWKYNNRDVEAWPKLRGTNWINKFTLNREGANYFSQNLDLVYSGELDTWDYGWVFNIWRQNGLAITPNCNLVTNIGFDYRATHTKETIKHYSINSETIVFPLQHPLKILRDKKADLFTIHHHFLGYVLPEDTGYFLYVLKFIKVKILWRLKYIIGHLTRFN